MKRLTDRQEIAQALNFGKYPVLEIDLAKCDEYGLKGSLCRIDMGEFRDGSKWYEKADLRVYRDERKLTFSSYGCCLSSSYTYTDFANEVERAMSPVVEPESEFVVAIHDSQRGEAYAVLVVKAGKARRHCQSPIMVEPVDLSLYVAIAEDRYGRDK